MIQLYGWATIQEEYETNDDYLSSVKSNLETEIAKFKWIGSSGMLNLIYLNGELTLNVSVKANRQREEVENVFDLFQNIANNAKGSFGIIYFHDDEDMDGKENEFRVYLLKRGEVIETNDNYLSPIIPTLED